MVVEGSYCVLWIMTPCSDVVRCQHFGGHWRWR